VVFGTPLGSPLGFNHYCFFICSREGKNNKRGFFSFFVLKTKDFREDK